MKLTLGFPGLDWDDLHTDDGLAKLLVRFDTWLAERDPAAAEALFAARATPDALDAAATSKLVLAVAPHAGAFVARLFGVEAELDALRARVLADEPVLDFRKRFVKKRLAKRTAPPAPADAAIASRAWAAAGRASDAADDEERSVAVATLRLLDAHELARKVARAGGASWTEDARALVAGLRAALPALADRDDEALLEAVLHAIEGALVARRASPGDEAARWPSLAEVRPQDFGHLVHLRRPAGAVRGESIGEVTPRGRPEPFALTDPRGGPRDVGAELELCMYCHERGKDSCSRGLTDKAGRNTKNPLGVELAGCPLGEKIGEAQALRRAGDPLGALVAITLDNPMCPGTGHRICNDCMKACIFQKQAPVNVPMVETRVLDEVLSLPWGFEIWSLLTRFSPLSLHRPIPRPHTGKKVLVVGLGPAGYTLAHYLLNEGFAVVAIDGLKIEPLPEAWLREPIRDVEALREPLESRTVLGFGGVSEYGITVRWDKSFLSMLYLNLARRAAFRAYGGVRFGGTITLEDAWALGFDHVAIAAGAGRPTLVEMKNGMARGVRQASDFLMGLQLGGAFRRDSLANLQLRLPAVVIGSGLTAIDTATEALAYYVVQVEKARERYLALVAEHGEAAVRTRFDEEELGVLDEQLAHGEAIAVERAAAAREGRVPELRSLLDAWGGVRVVYRRRLVDSPAYRLNHEEVEKSLEEGVRYVELLSPLEVHVDRFGAAEAVTFAVNEQEDGRLRATDARVRIPARAIFVAAGTHPNVTYEREYPGTFELDARGYFASHAAHRAEDGAIALAPGDGFFTSHRGPGGQLVSYYGDNHPRYAGSVVKAMASAKDGHRAVSALFGEPPPAPLDTALFARLDDELRATVHAVRELAPGIVEVVVRAPRAARRFQPGQFYRLQSFERHARRIDETTLATEGIALTGASTDPEAGLLSMIVLEMGVSSRLCRHLEVGEPVVVMGPTGRPSDIRGGENVLLVGGGLGNAVLFSIAKAFRAAGSRVLYFAGYRDGGTVFERDQIEAGTEQVIWASDTGPPIAPRRLQDAHFRGNVVEAMLAYARGELGPRRVPLDAIHRVLAIGSDGMMRAVAEARKGALAPYLSPAHVALGSINSPMQCMLKEVCAQCLQRHVDPVSGEETLVYSCFDQDQELDRVDFSHLRQRLRQSSMQEKLSALWFEERLPRAAE
ncbi:MAG: FAD-dependent oxidoreductase [Sandaracinaceae bacterium]|nr:FAD-dependent oxidoreductase [Sandaracinaceae bacterium]